MKKIVITLFALSIQLAAQVPAEWCHGIVNTYHCGLPDERVPFVVANVRMPNPVPVFPLPTTHINSAGINEYQICLGDGICQHFNKETYETIMRLSYDMAKDLANQPRQRSIRSGSDAELAALGSKVEAGIFAMGHVCIPKQKYTFTIGLQDRYTDITFTCLNDPTHLELSSPKIRNYREGKLVPYTGGPTWTNVR